MDKQSSIQLKDFYEAARDVLSLELISGKEFLDRNVQEVYLSRPGLALAGYLQHFANRRIQVLGLSENTYLKQLDDKKRKEHLETIFEQTIPCIILTRNRHPYPEIIELAAAYKVPVMRTPMVTNEFMHAGTILIESLVSPRQRVQGTMIDIKGIGLLLEGSPGIGKSETALGLIQRGHSLVSDDVTILRRVSWGALMGTAVDLTKFHIEIRGVGIIHVPSLYGVTSVRAQKQLDIIVKLYRDSTDKSDTEIAPCREILGVQIPVIYLHVDVGRDMAHIVELAALNHRLKVLGHDAAKELDAKVVELLTRKKGIMD